MPRPTQILKSVGKTINLAKPQVYQVPRKPPLNSLVFEKLPEPVCGDRIAVSKAPTPKPVRVCTKEELQAMYCCPCPCDCKPIKPRLTPAQKIANALLLLAKSLLVGALVYYTWAEGLWSDSEHTLLLKTAFKVFLVHEMVKYTWREGLWSDGFHSSCFLSKFVQYCPVVKEDPENEFEDKTVIVVPDPEPCLPFIPRSDNMLYMLSRLWNKSVLLAFWAVLEGPMEFCEFLYNFFFPVQPEKQVDPCDLVRARKRD